MQRHTVPGPVSPPQGHDLRTMLRQHLAQRAIDALSQGASQREAACADKRSFNQWATQIRRQCDEMLGLTNAFDTLDARTVNRREYADFVLENVLFNAIGGWQVNASVFIPRHHDGPYRAIVVPCGHSPKTQPAYQLVCQTFALAGYVAITFDPPGQGSEKNEGNDHFRDGPRCWAVGQTSARYFVADAIRAMDYLDTRHDIDKSDGYVMTGVSGGGHTTMWAGLIDSRIKVSAPVCCATLLADHPIADSYAMCAEALPFHRLTLGIDDLDQMAAFAPKPMLYMAGREDSIMSPEFTTRLAAGVQQAYDAAGASDRFTFELLDIGHHYTPDMARRFVAFAEQHWNKTAPPRSRHYDRDPEMLPAEAMHCQPAAEPNMRTLSVQRANQMHQRRPRLRGRADAAAIVRTLVPGLDEDRPAPTVNRHPPQRTWGCNVHELLLSHEDGIHLPSTALLPVDGKPRGCVVAFDDRGRWANIRYQSILTRLAGVFDKDTNAQHPAVLSVDLRGWGDTAPSHTAFDVASWSGLDRYPNDIAIGLGDSLMGQRVRDAVTATQWWLDENDASDAQLVIIGQGLGAMAGLLAATQFEHIAGVVCIDSPVSVQALLEAPQIHWDLSVFMHDLLGQCDLDSLAEALGPVLHVRPRDAYHNALNSRTEFDAIDWIADRLREA